MRIILLCVVTLISSHFTSIADDSAQDSDAQKFDTQVQTPEQVVSSFWKHLAANEIEQAQKLLSMPIADPRIAKNPDGFLKELAKLQAKTESYHFFDQKEIEDLAVVVMGGEGPQYIDRIDIDPMFLRKRNNAWKIIFARDASDLKENELTDQIHRERAKKLIAWYEKRELEIRADWKKKQAAKSNKIIPDRTTP